MWLGIRQQLEKLSSHSLILNGTEIAISATAKNLGVTFSSELNMDANARSVSRSCFYQLKQLHLARSGLTWEATLTLVHAFVSSHIDYCNSVFATRLRDLQTSQHCCQTGHWYQTLWTHDSSASGRTILVACPSTNCMQARIDCLPLTQWNSSGLQHTSKLLVYLLYIDLLLVDVDCV